VNVETGEGSRLLHGTEILAGKHSIASTRNKHKILLFVRELPVGYRLNYEPRRVLVHFLNFGVDKGYSEWSKISPLVKNAT
jgi:hypothetical protein